MTPLNSQMFNFFNLLISHLLHLLVVLDCQSCVDSPVQLGCFLVIIFSEEGVGFECDEESRAAAVGGISSEPATPGSQ